MREQHTHCSSSKLLFLQCAARSSRCTACHVHADQCAHCLQCALMDVCWRHQLPALGLQDRWSADTQKCFVSVIVQGCSSISTMCQFGIIID